MNTKPTSSLCSNFGHNFYREKTSGRNSDVIRCKQCGITIEMNNQGDVEEVKKENFALHQSLKQLFLLQNSLRLRSKRRRFQWQ